VTHSAGGDSRADYPSLAGQEADYLARALHEYKQGDRKNPVMSTSWPASRTRRSKIAKYYSQQRPACARYPAYLDPVSE